MTYSPQGLGDALGVGPVAKRWNNNFNCQNCHVSSQTGSAPLFSPKREAVLDFPFTPSNAARSAEIT